MTLRLRVSLDDTTMGISGARFQLVSAGIVRKWGGPDVYEQGRYLQRLGDKACPKIFHVDDVRGCYDMEFLLPHDTHGRETKSDIIADGWDIAHILEEHVWPRPSVYARAELQNWREPLAGFLSKLSYQYVETMKTLYPASDWWDEAECMIHGDPTIANMMHRTTGEPVLIDAIAPRGKMPSLREVDLGKVSQSMLGWEELLGDRPRGGGLDCFNAWLAQQTDRGTHWKQKIQFWTGIHCARILPYAPSNAVHDWARRYAVRLLDAVRV